MKKLKELLLTFAMVTTGILCAATIYITVFWKDASLEVRLLWELLACSVLCCFGNFIWTEREVSKREWLVRVILHYIYINVIVLGCGIQFEWFYWKDWKMVFLMVVIIFLVFSVIIFVMFQMNRKEEKVLNQRLEEFRREKETEEN